MKKKPKTKIRRDRKALDKTLTFLSTERGGKATNSGHVAKKFGVSKATATARLTALASQGKAERLGHGSYRAKAASAAVKVPTLVALDGIDELLVKLKKRRAELDADILLLEQTVALRKKWGVK